MIVGGGGHGLATAYYLAKEHNLKNIAVVEKGWIGGGNTGRNTTIIRSNYLWDASAGIYDHALKIWFWLFLAGAMTLIPLYLYLKGVELAGLGPAGMIFFLAPTGQFLLGVFYYGEYLDINKLISFVIIWIAVTIYLHDLSREKVR